MNVGSYIQNPSKGVMLGVLYNRITREWQFALLAGENAKQNGDSIDYGKRKSGEKAELSIY